MQQSITFYEKYTKDTTLPLPKLTDIMVYLKTTETCQLDCKHCFTNGANGQKVYFNPQHVIRWLHNLKELYPTMNSSHIAFHGGEPFLAPVQDMRMVWDECKDLWDGMWWSATTNLVYNLDDEKRDFMKTVFTQGLSTSWDKDMRFANKKQEALWHKNVQTLLADGHNITLSISLNKSLMSMDINQFIDFVESTGVQYLLLERITPNGNATRNTDIFPTNLELDAWFLNLWNACLQRNTHKRFQNLFFNAILTGQVYNTSSGCRSRSCEQKIFTLNANGTIGGCPNGAVETTFGNILDSIPSLLTSRVRTHNIACEMTRNPICYTCDVYDICNGDCHQLHWDGDICASPKSMMRQIKSTDIEILKDVLSDFVGSE